jgi:FMN-dependent NADH-azoreductase
MRLLHIVSTPRSHESNTVRISNALIEGLYLKYEDLNVKVLDLFKVDLPAVAGVNIESKYKLMTGQVLDDHQKSSWNAIEENIHRFLDADIYVITTPMWNFGIPYALKYYIDAIIQPGYLFRYDEKGVPYGLVTGKSMFIVTSRGGDYSPNSYMHHLDYVEPYLKAIFNFVGITDIYFINAQPTDITPELRKDALKRAIDEAKAVAASYPSVFGNRFETVQFPDGVKPAPLPAD